MSQALEESRRMYEEENRNAPPDERLEVITHHLVACVSAHPCHTTYPAMTAYEAEAYIS